MDERLTARISSAFREIAVAERADHDQEWVRTRFSLFDEPYPLVVDVVAGTTAKISRVVYMLPGGGLNFCGNFFTPREHNLAHFLRRHGYLVVGITPREDALEPSGDDPVAATWGLAKRKRDNHKIIELIDQALRMPYDILGHSVGGIQALDYAAGRAARAGQAGPGGRLGRVMVLDTTGPYDPAAEPALTQRARDTAAGFRDLLHAPPRFSLSYTVDPGLKALVRAAVDDPAGRSAGALRPDGSPFTNAGIAHYALIKTAELPGPLNWIYEQGLSTGTYAWGTTPAHDRFALHQTPLSTWAEALAEVGSGLIVTAQLRDLTAVLAGDRATYAIDWAKIDVPVAWVNMALGRGDHTRGADLIRAGGNPEISFTVVPGYGHADPAWGRNAQDDVWPLLVPCRAGGDCGCRAAVR
jgi:pimeloyl-ACP methyl ester carboxylesterase